MNSNNASELEVALAVCRDVRDQVEPILGSAIAPMGNGLKLLLVSKCLRARLLFKAIVLLAEQELASPASALMRCLTELKFVAVAVARNPELIQKLANDDARHRGRAMRNLYRLPDHHKAANVTAASVDKVLGEIGTPKAETRVAEWAKLANCEAEYDLAYLLLSNDVHPGLRATESHLVLDDKGTPVGLDAQPDIQELPYRLMHACDCYLAIVHALPEGTLSEAGFEIVHKLFADERKQGINQRALAEVEARSPAT